jgi:hypothetical protein
MVEVEKEWCLRILNDGILVIKEMG